MPSRISRSRVESFPDGMRIVWPSCTVPGLRSEFMLKSCSTVMPAQGGRGGRAEAPPCQWAAASPREVAPLGGGDKLTALLGYALQRVPRSQGIRPNLDVKSRVGDHQPPSGACLCVGQGQRWQLVSRWRLACPAAQLAQRHHPGRDITCLQRSMPCRHRPRASCCGQHCAVDVN